MISVFFMLWTYWELQEGPHTYMVGMTLMWPLYYTENTRLLTCLQSTVRTSRTELLPHLSFYLQCLAVFHTEYISISIPFLKTASCYLPYHFLIFLFPSSVPFPLSSSSFPLRNLNIWERIVMFCQGSVWFRSYLIFPCPPIFAWGCALTAQHL